MTEPGEGVDAPVGGGVSPDEGWERFHPVSPLLRGGLVLIAFVGYLLSTFVDDLLGGFGGSTPEPPEGTDGTSFEVSVFSHPLITAGVGLLAVLGAAALGVGSWWFTRYRLGPRTLELRSGVVFRQHRELRYTQIQAVSTAQPLLARLVGLAEVRVESAGGSDSHVSLAYLGRAEAEALRSRIIGLAQRAGADPGGVSGTREEDGPSGPDGAAVGTVILRMPLGRLVGSIVLSAGAITAVVLAVVALVLAWRFGAVAITGLAPPLLFAALGSVRQLLTWANLVVEGQGDTLRSRHGLTDLATSTVPTRRVQAVELVQPLLWRRPDWWRLSVNIAGVQVGGEGVVDDGVLVPAATRGEARALVEALSPATDSSVALAVMDRGLPPEAVRCPPSARWLDPWSWQRRGVLLADEVAVIRQGRLGRVVTVVPWGRIQSVALEQGPLDRHLGLARLRLVSTVGAVSPMAEHLGVEDARLLESEIRLRASLARHDQDPSVRPEHLAGADVIGWTLTDSHRDDEEG